MKQTWYTIESTEALRGAFGRIGQPYSGAAPRVHRVAKVGRDGDVYTPSAHRVAR